MTKNQKVKMMTDLANQIAVRNHVSMIVNGPRTALTAPNIRALTKFVSDVDKEIVDTVLKHVNSVNEMPPSLVKDLALAEARNVKAQVKATEEEKPKEETKPKKESKNAARKGVVRRVLE